jgi:DMSO/TMAO reductase YedYZ molybdopterin-dependent catalytic subunit
MGFKTLMEEFVMAIILGGFSGRRSAADVKLPPGQYLTTDFPVLSAGPTAHVPLDKWEFVIDDGKNVLRRWDWKSFRNLPSEKITVDLHCVTRWSKLGTPWEGVSLDTLFTDIATDASYTLFHSYGDYTTNVPLKDLLNKQGWIAFRYDAQDLAPEHGGPARLLVPHLYLWKSAKWVRGMTLMREDKAGFWEGLGYHIYGDPWQEQRYSGDR